MSMRLRIRLAGAAMLAGLFIVGCVISTTTQARKVTLVGPMTVTSAFRAHMLDGSMVAFPRGATFSTSMVAGEGTRFSVTRGPAGMPTSTIPIDSVVGFEVYERWVNPVRTAIYLPLSVAATGTVAFLMAVALFGSCPTIYADSAGTPVLQAESFSYSISPLLAKRDVDRLDVRPDANGVIRLDVRNEALETHYIDQLELLEVSHRADEFVVPAPRGTPVAVSDLVAPASARDRTGRDVRRLIAAADQAVFTSVDSVLADAAAGGRSDDYLELAVPRVPGRDSLAVVLRMRSSLLSTEVLYDHMLSRPGPQSLDWLAVDLSHITTLARLATWYTDNFGLRVSVYDGSAWRPVVRLMDFGPVAWRDVAAIVPAFGDTVRIRLGFTADEWRIDQATIAWGVRRTAPRTISVSRISVPGSAALPDAKAALERVGDRPLVTLPGQRFFADFDVGRSTTPRTFFVAASGYYTEWVRPQWIDRPAPSEPFNGSLSMPELLRSWIASKDSLERRFFTARVPVL